MRRPRVTGGILRPPSSSTPRKELDPLGWIRRLCMALPGTAEVNAWGHPNFRVAGHTFAVFEIYKGRPCIAISADPEEQTFLVERFGFFKTPYVGNRGWVTAWVDQPAPFRLMADIIRQAHRRSGESPRRARKVTARRRSSPARSRQPRPRAV